MYIDKDKSNEISINRLSVSDLEHMEYILLHFLRNYKRYPDEIDPEDVEFAKRLKGAIQKMQ